jgi:hypothetical protein
MHSGTAAGADKPITLLVPEISSVIGSASATLMMSRAAQARPSTGRIHVCSRVQLDPDEEIRSGYLTEESIHEVLGDNSTRLL